MFKHPLGQLNTQSVSEEHLNVESIFFGMQLTKKIVINTTTNIFFILIDTRSRYKYLCKIRVIIKLNPCYIPPTLLVGRVAQVYNAEQNYLSFHIK